MADARGGCRGGLLWIGWMKVDQWGGGWVWISGKVDGGEGLNGFVDQVGGKGAISGFLDRWMEVDQ